MLLTYEYLKSINSPSLEFFNQEYISKNTVDWWIEKISLIKEYAHNQDKEWRILANWVTDGIYTKTVKPYAIIFGLRTSEKDKIMLTELAKEAGIKHIGQAVINDNDELVNKEVFI